MWSVIVETIASGLAEYFAGKAAEKGLQRAGKVRGWIALGILLALLVFLIWLGVYLIRVGVWPISVLLFLIAALLLYVTGASVVKARRGKTGNAHPASVPGDPKDQQEKS